MANGLGLWAPSIHVSIYYIFWDRRTGYCICMEMEDQHQIPCWTGCSKTNLSAYPLLSSGCSNAVRWLYVHGPEPEPETDNNNKFFLSFAQSHRVTFEKKQAKLNITAVQRRLQLFCNAHGTHTSLCK